MAVEKPHIKSGGLQFITFTNSRWLPLIEIANAYDLVYKWFSDLKGRGHKVTSYVIMPNHLHVIICFGNDKRSINQIVSTGKRFISYGITDRLKEMGRHDLLSICDKVVSVSEKKRGTNYKVFKHSFDMKECFSLPFLLQKIAYIHNNPVSKKWSLAPDAASYPHSSANFYETGKNGLFDVTHFMDL